ncbi:ABC transporter substrate-binding protein [Tsukamurella sp. 8F]|uniref:ABC transporter substrate-binding protein n=1 Tax=unclassified Tsukamurella TaxID=2633480 RepID=UPI0023BA2D36|nr:MULTISPECIES: ABC transporter substrate-binding protein [unclassified Tsukamurella]MDF0529234.1 ABC transporter substrate-binding protein [Tsukamurella sp. 8J]MDF0585419.1 ABC transporter substrate-binding protein [Tsukamurella sp. 8F]
MRPVRPALLAVLTVAALTATACGASGTEATTASVTDSSGKSLNLTSKQDRIIPAKVDSIAAEVPAAIRQRGDIVIAQGSGAGNPPFGFPASDNDSVFIGDEVDISNLIAGVLGLKLETTNTSWEGLFLGIDSGRYDLGVSNITVTEARKDKYDFATYRKDNLAVEVAKDSTLTFTGPQSFDGKTIAVGSGTNQEKILQQYDADVKAKGGKGINIKYYQDTTGVYSALASGQIDAYFSPYPVSAFHVAQTVGTPQATKIVGNVSGAGTTLQGLIAATTKKGSGLVKAVQDAINHVIANGDYAKVLAKWNLSGEAVTKSEINPPGLPRDNK